MNSKKAYLYILLAVFFWSTVATAFKISLKYLTVIQFLFVSSLTSTAVLFLVNPKKLKFSKSSLQRSAFYGILNPFAYYFILFSAYNLLPAQIAQSINYTWPIVLAVFSSLFLKQRATPANYAGILMSFLGAVIISVFGQRAFMGNISVFGVFLAFLSAFVWAAFWILNLKDDREEGTKLFLNFLFGTIYIFAVFIISGSFRGVNAKGILPAAYAGVFEMGITYFLFVRALKLSNSSAKISGFAYLSPFLSLIFIGFVLKEKILLSTVVGLALVVSGIIISNAKFKNA